ncbi:MAG: dual specificity protein phosphatase family protein [Nitrospira sp.]|nr:dual specificity protein phosphatase family protein [Nitrospira sp.]
MIEVYPNLFVGNESDYEFTVKGQDGWWIVHACKEPYHRQELGYRGRGAPKDHPEYLIARRSHRLILNLVDVDNPAYIAKEIVDAALAFVDEGLCNNNKVLIHCNQGQSRSPTIALLYLARQTDQFQRNSFPEAEEKFRRIYPLYQPALGMRQFAAINWDSYVSSEETE